MANKFAIIGVSGIALCAICLAGAATLGGSALTHAGFDFANWGRPRCDTGGAIGSREIAWDGSDKAGVRLPSDVHYHRGQGDMLVVKGPAGVISQVRLNNGKITLGCSRNANTDIFLPGRDFRQFVLEGAGDADLDGIDQQSLKITMMGAGDISASGHADRLEVTRMGAGDVHMGDLSAGTVKLVLMGAGDAEVAPVDRLWVQSMGAGDVTLRHEPRQIESHMMGPGEIIHAAPNTPSGDDKKI